MKLGKILFRCDGSSEIGYGHLNRCLTIAQWMRGKFDVALCVKKHKSILSVIKKSGITVNYLPESATSIQVMEGVKSFSKEWQPKVIVNDIKDTSIDYMRSIQDIKLRTINFDDLGEGSDYADVLVDANRRENKKRLFGPTYVVIHSDYAREHKKKRNLRKVVRNVLISVGGGDPNDFTTRILEGLGERDKSFNTLVVLGPTFENAKKIKSAFKHFENIAFTEKLETLVKPLLWADLSIVNGGLTMFESTCLGTPTLVLSQNEDELKNVKRLERKGAVVDIGLGEKMSPNKLNKRVSKVCDDVELRKELMQTGKEVVDGQGLFRVVGVIEKYVRKR